jgi:para-nitrobenzyl esterase
MYEWDYESSGFGGKFGAVHGTDVSASFYNYRDGIGGTGSPQEKALWQRFASCWVSLALTGNPNWPAYDSDKRATMIFNTESHVEDDPRAEIRSFWQEMPAARRGITRTPWLDP